MLIAYEGSTFVMLVVLPACIMTFAYSGMFLALRRAVKSDAFRIAREGSILSRADKIYLNPLLREGSNYSKQSKISSPSTQGKMRGSYRYKEDISQRELSPLMKFTEPWNKCFGTNSGKNLMSPRQSNNLCIVNIHSQKSSLNDTMAIGKGNEKPGQPKKFSETQNGIEYIRANRNYQGETESESISDLPNEYHFQSYGRKIINSPDDSMEGPNKVCGFKPINDSPITLDSPQRNSSPISPNKTLIRVSSLFCSTISIQRNRNQNNGKMSVAQCLTNEKVNYTQIGHNEHSKFSQRPILKQLEEIKSCRSISSSPARLSRSFRQTQPDLIASKFRTKQVRLD